MALPLGNIINLSIKLSTFPEECKIAKLKPIFKKGARTDLENYRPISLLPVVSEIIEKSIHFQIEAYLNKKKLIYMYQSGFRTNHSTDLCLAQLIDFVATGMDKQMHTGMILVDLQKAFDTLPYGVLTDVFHGFFFFLKKLKLKLQKAQNKCICFCLNLPPRSHIDPAHFRKINWLVTE